MVKESTFTLETYKVKILDLLSPPKWKRLLRRLKNKSWEEENRSLANEQTHQYLKKCSTDEKGELVKFLHGEGFIMGENCIIKLKDADLREINLSGEDLGGIDLSGVNLSRANFSKANLASSNLSEAILIEANFCEADLRGSDLSKTAANSSDFSAANLSRADVSFANFSSYNEIPWLEMEEDLSPDKGPAKMVAVNLSKALINGARFDFVDLSQANLQEIRHIRPDVPRKERQPSSFYGAKLHKANLKHCSLGGRIVITYESSSPFNFSQAFFPSGGYREGERNINFSHADLSESNLEGAKLEEANLFQANLSEANLSNAYLQQADLSYANLSKAKVDGADFSSADLSHTILKGSVDLKKTSLRWAKFISADLEKVDLAKVDLAHVDFSGSNLSGANLSNTSLHSTSFSNASLFGILLDGAKMSGTDFSNANFTQASLKDITYYKSENSFLSSSLKNTKFHSAIFDGADLSGGDFGTGVFNLNSFRKANLKGCNFKKSNIIFADFSEADLSQADFREAIIKNALFHRTQLKGASFNPKFLEEAKVGLDHLEGKTLFSHLDLLPQPRIRLLAPSDIHPATEELSKALPTSIWNHELLILEELVPEGEMIEIPEKALKKENYIRYTHDFFEGEIQYFTPARIRLRLEFDCGIDSAFLYLRQFLLCFLNQFGIDESNTKLNISPHKLSEELPELITLGFKNLHSEDFFERDYTQFFHIHILLQNHENKSLLEEILKVHSKLDGIREEILTKLLKTPSVLMPFAEMALHESIRNLRHVLITKDGFYPF